MDVKKLNKNTMSVLLNKIEDNDLTVYGKYLYKDYKIIISRKDPFSNSERAKKFYANRRSLGLCVYCGVKVDEKNPKTKKSYRYCETHRKMENDKRKKRRDELKNINIKKSNNKKTANIKNKKK